MSIPEPLRDFYERYYYQSQNFYCDEPMPEEYELEPPSDIQSDPESSDDEEIPNTNDLPKRTRGQ